ncbi:MAG: translocation/assembly module TamB domain-containing protein [Cetobacterium sp.]
MIIFEKCKKLIFVTFPLFIFLSGALLIRINLPKIVEIILKVAIGPTISSQEIKFTKFGEIEIKKLVLSKNDKDIIRAPKVIITYSKESLKNFRLKEINLENPWIHIERKGSVVNIVEAFSNPNKPSSDTKAGTTVPIDIITVKNGVSIFTDNTYSRQINQDIENIDGYIKFDKIKGLDLQLEGNNKNELYEYRINNLNEPLDMNIILKNVELKSELIQYGYDDKDLSEATGLINMNLTIATSGLKGYVELMDGIVKYDDLNELVRDINGKIKFDEKGIGIKFEYNLNKNPGIFNVFYSEESGVKVEFKFKDLPYSTAKSYKMLGDLNLPLDELKFKNLDVELTYKQDLGFKAQIFYNAYPILKPKIKLENLNGKLEFENGILGLSGNKLKITLLEIDYKKDFTYNLDLNLREEDLKFKVKSNFIDLDGEYNKKDKLINLYQNSKKSFVYDLKNNNLNFINLEGKNLINNYKFFIKATEENKMMKIEEISMINDENQKVFQTKGEFNTENFKYNLKVYAKNLKEKELFGEKKIEIKLDFIGEISGEKEKFILRGNVKDFKVENKDVLLDSYANISIINNKTLQGKIDGEFREIKYKNYRIQGVKVNSNYSDGKLNITDIRNDLFKLVGEVDILKKHIDLSYNINGLTSNEFENKPLNIILDNVEGKIIGSFENFEALVDIKKAFIELPNKELVLLNGAINYKNNLISTTDFRINQSLATINYNTNEKSGDFILNILEENLAKYYNFKSLKYRILSRVSGKIEKDNIKAEIGINIDRVYLNGKPIPNIMSNLIYKKDSLENVLKIDSLDLLNLNRKKILFSKGLINLRDNTIEFNIPTQKIALKDFEGLINTKDMNGNIKIKSSINGELKNPKYSVELFDGDYVIKGFEFSRISLNLTGDKQKVDVNEVLAYYQKNEIRGEGEYKLNSRQYDFNIYSKNIDLTFLNALLPKEVISDVSGIANIDVKLSSLLKNNSGYVDLIDFNANLPKALLYLKNLNIILKIDNERLTVDSLVGILNKGEIKGNGYLDLPSIDEISADEEFYKNLKYAFNLTLKNVIYELKDYFRVDMSTNLTYSENKISGNIILNNGEITGILKEDKGLILTVLNFIIDKTRNIIGKSKKLGEDFEIKGKLDETPEFNVKVMIKDGIDINILDISTFAQDIQGVLLGRFDLFGKNDNINVTGELEIQKGKFVLGNEDFIVTRAFILSDKRNGNITDFNPNLIFDISSLTSGGNVEISLQGELNSLRLNIVTNQGSESSSLKNLFEGSGTGGDKNIIAMLFKTLIDSQISSTLLRPISKTIKNTFHISKFRIVSDVFNQEVLVNSDNPKAQDPNAFSFGAYLEAENPIYKDKYFWILKLGIIDGSKYDISESSAENKSNEVSSSVNQFDFKVERRYRSGWSYGVGVSRLNEKNMIDEKKEGNLNYYVDFKFERKYNNIKDVFLK